MDAAQRPVAWQQRLSPATLGDKLLGQMLLCLLFLAELT